MAEHGEMVKIMAYLSAHFPRFELTEATFDAYQDVLHDIPADLLKAAAKQYASSGKFFPFASDLRDAAFAIRAQSEGIPSPAEAWGEVMRELRRIGSWGAPQFSTPLIDRAVDGLGGWSALCHSDSNVADRAHFLKIYGALLERHEQDAAMLPEIRQVIAELSAQMDTPQLEDGND